jgi:mannose-6-phosphate isomerase-like protein (cupin superfamily)
MPKVNLAEKLALFKEHWSPKIVGQLNGQLVKLVKVQGEFVWHHHDEQDELFMVLKGQLVIKLEETDVVLKEGEFFIVPRGVTHCPRAEKETHLLVFEPADTLNTGNVRTKQTVDKLENL